jgi:peptidoglycan/LPS O-acetylase OafA/YrhL
MTTPASTEPGATAQPGQAAEAAALSAEPRDPLAASGRTFAYRPDLDGIRGVLVPIVLIAHLGWITMFPGATACIDVFFVLSGYLITHIIVSDRAAGKFGYARYYERRIRRLFPALFAVMAVAAPIGFWVVPEAARAPAAASLAATALYANNILIGLHPMGAFAHTPLTHTWSMGVEEQYYLLYPPLLIGLLARGRITAFWDIAACTALLLIVSLTFSPSISSYFLTTSRVWEIFLGCALALHGGRLAFSAAVREVLGFLGCAMILGAALTIPTLTAYHSLNVIPACVGAALIILANEGSMTWTGRLLSRQPFRFLGVISYSVYLWHWPINVVAAQFWKWPNFPLWVQPLLFAASIAAGAASWRYLEMPFRRPGGVFTQRGTFVAAIAGIAAFALIGAVGFAVLRG